MTPTKFSFMDRFGLFKFFMYVAIRSWSTPNKSWQLFVDFVTAEQARKQTPTKTPVIDLISVAAEGHMAKKSKQPPVCETTGKFILTEI